MGILKNIKLSEWLTLATLVTSVITSILVYRQTQRMHKEGHRREMWRDLESEFFELRIAALQWLKIEYGGTKKNREKLQLVLKNFLKTHIENEKWLTKKDSKFWLPGDVLEAIKIASELYDKYQLRLDLQYLNLRDKVLMPDLKLRGADLTGADLRGAQFFMRTETGLGVDFSNAILCNSDWTGVQFNPADLSGADLRGAKILAEQLQICKINKDTRLDENLRKEYEELKKRLGET